MLPFARSVGLAEQNDAIGRGKAALGLLVVIAVVPNRAVGSASIWEQSVGRECWPAHARAECITSLTLSIIRVVVRMSGACTHEAIRASPSVSEQHVEAHAL